MPGPGVVDCSNSPKQCECEDGVVDRKYAQNPPRIKNSQGSPHRNSQIGRPAPQEDPRNQETAQHEKKLYASAPRQGLVNKPRRPMRDCNRDDSKRTEAVELRHAGRI